MKRWVCFTAVLCIVSFFACACGSSVTTETPATLPDGTVNGTLPQVTQSEKTTCLPVTTPGATPNPTEKPFDMTLDGEGVSAVWWWDRYKASETRRGKYLDFLERNSINEIYICWPDFDADKLASFVLDAGERGIKVSLLSGDASWIYPDNRGAESIIEEFLEYQKNASSGTRLSSLHLDVEPHQLEAFNNDREQILQYYADLVMRSSKTVRSNGERIEWDIPFWFDEYEVINENGEKEDILELLARNSDTLCLMSYRDTAKAVLECSEKEIALGSKHGCRIVLGVETHSSEGDHVSFMEEGKETMYRECENIYRELSKRLDGGKFGIAVHYLDTWYELKDRM